MEAELEFRGRKEERTLAERVFQLMTQQGAMYALDAPIRLSLGSLADYFIENRLLRRAREDVERVLEQALTKNDHIFAREERSGEIVYMTTRRGQPVGQQPARTVPARQLHPAPEGATPTPRRRTVHRPPMSPFWVRAAIRQMQPARAAPAVAAAVPAMPTVEELASAAAVRKRARVTKLKLSDGTTIDFSREVEEILALAGDTIARYLEEALERDFRLVSFGDQWYLDDRLEHFSKGRLNEIRRYVLEEEVALSDQTILGDLLFKSPRDPDYELWAFSLNARLLREKKEFEFVGVPGANLWTAKGLPSIGSRYLKAAEIGQDYAYLLDEAEVAEIPLQWEHFLTFYEYHHGLLPYDAQAQVFFPPALLEDQRAAYLRFEIPQHYESYTVELRYPSGNRGGWLWGLEEFFHNSLVPGALILISRTQEPNVFVLQYLATDAQDRDLLVLDERKNRYIFEETTFYCETEDSLVLAADKFPRLRNSKPLPPSTRKRPADVVANAFTLVGQKEGSDYRASLVDLFPVANIERPFSMNLLRQVLEETDVFSPADEEGFYLYSPSA